MSIMVLYLLVYSVYLLVFHTGGLIRLIQKESKIKHEKSIGLENITAIIPCRNEEKRINQLLDSIKKSLSLPCEIIFVDDHCDDRTHLLIEKVQNSSIKLISLDNKIGKKRAIEKGIREAKTDFILTLDADVSFSPDYFNKIGNLHNSDLHILPVKHFSTRFFNRFIQQDILLADLLNQAIAGWIRPIFCSGANLLIKKDEYLAAIKQTSYFEIDSGDDILLLREFHRQNKKIEFHTDSSIEVETELPSTYKEVIHQRMRWLGKSFKVGDRLANSLALIQLTFSLLNFAFIITTLVFFPLKFALLMIAVKTILELLFSFNYYQKSNQLRLWLTTPIYLLILPLINTIMAFAFLGFKPEWKGRLVVQ